MKKYFYILFLFLVNIDLFAQSQLNIPGGVKISFADNPAQGEGVTTIKILLILTLLTIAPAIILAMTSFARVVIVLSFTRQALGTQSLPPNQIIIGLSLFITFFVMAPVFDKINNDALQPYINGKIDRKAFLNNASEPLKKFMFSQVYEEDLKLFLAHSGLKDKPKTLDDLSLRILIPAFITSEIRRGFQMGFMIFIPFIVLDIIVASILMSMGMMMLPPAIISLPLKIMLFVLVNGWDLIIGSLLKSF
jgi:flagellar biosynthetic protein FliP